MFYFMSLLILIGRLEGHELTEGSTMQKLNKTHTMENGAKTEIRVYCNMPLTILTFCLIIVVTYCLVIYWLTAFHCVVCV